MSKTSKIILTVFCVLAGMVLLTVILAVILFPGEKIKSLIENEKLNRQMSENWKNIVKVNSLQVIFEEMCGLMKVRR